jgi:hypothetical protein
LARGVAVLRRQVRRLHLKPADRAVLAALSQVLLKPRWPAFWTPDGQDRGMGVVR